jgi:hypothetical protein
MSMWALARIIQENLVDKSNPVFWVSSILFTLGAILLVEAFLALGRGTHPPQAQFTSASAATSY